MFGLIGKITAQVGERDALATILVEGVGGMPGCLNYVVSRDSVDPQALWIHEVWDSAESHQASLALPEVRDAVARGRPLIRAFETVARTEPVGGYGLAVGDG